jgi:hypothetical protein
MSRPASPQAPAPAGQASQVPPATAQTPAAPPLVTQGSATAATPEPVDVDDFAFDPTVVDGIVQASSLVMGYVYRPYSAHSAVFGLNYLW